jgi:hypothetical protein
MSYASEAYFGEFDAVPASAPEPAASTFPLRRSKLIPIPFAIPTLICLVSWLAGGIPLMTDMGFVILTLICLVYLIVELVKFPQRYGIGGIVLFGGVLVWFCHDYWSNWLGVDFRAGVVPFGPELIARVACLYSLFVGVMSIGLLIPKGQWLVRLILRAPEPANANVYLGIWIALVVIGLLPFALFTTDGLFSAMIGAAAGSITGTTIHWTVGRTGNYNYNWGGYVAQIIEIGEFSSVFGIFYGIFICRSKLLSILPWINWLYWLMYSFESGRRGEVAAQMIPAIGFLYIKFQLQTAAASGRPRQSVRAYVMAGVLILGTLFVVQYQGYFRDVGLNSSDLSQFELFKNQGNSMFSESLAGFQQIPDHHPIFRGSIPGEGAVLALPETLFWFSIGPIPRALWINKPADSATIWYNALNTGSEGLEGTTVSQGIVGHWYFRYGLLGMIEGALLIGWLMGIVERILQNSGDKPLGILYSLVLMAWLFRIYRNFYFGELYGWIIGAAAFAILVTLLSPLSSQKA